MPPRVNRFVIITTSLQHTEQSFSLRVVKGALSILVLVSLSFPVSAAGGNCAYADTAEAKQAMTKAQKAVEKSADAYDKAQDKADEARSKADDAQSEVTTLQKKVEDNKSRISKLQAEIPVQQKASDKAVCTLYRMSQNATGMLEMFLGSGSLIDFLNQMEYMTRIQSENIAQITKLSSMKDELEEKQSNLESDMAAAKKAQSEAEAAASKAESAESSAKKALTKAQAARKKAKAQYEAQVKAEKEAAAKAAKEKKDAEEAAASVRSGALAEGSDNSGSSVSKESSDSKVTSEVKSDDADWSESKTEFVNKWAPRIDAFLEGSPLAGQGKTFAVAAWKYNVDPRWSPAISYIESSRGEHCFKSHNAWGWGSSSWDSWEEAIDAHVAGLARMYGYTLTLAAAKKYCPPNWKYWYNNVGAKMNSI